MIAKEENDRQSKEIESLKEKVNEKDEVLNMFREENLSRIHKRDQEISKLRVSLENYEILNSELVEKLKCKNQNSNDEEKKKIINLNKQIEDYQKTVSFLEINLEEKSFFFFIRNIIIFINFVR
jgi:hypothetical protein